MGAIPRLERRAFTLVELLVVIAIIGVLVALLLPAVQAAREAARRMQCGNNLKQVGLGLAAYESSRKEYPAGRYGCDSLAGTVGPCAVGGLASDASGFVFLLPYLEMQSLYDTLNPTDAKGALMRISPVDAWHTPQRLAGLALRPPMFVCPSSDSLSHIDYDDNLGVNINWTPKPATGTYAFVAGINGPSFTSSSRVKMYNTGPFIYLFPVRSREIADGLTATYFVGEVTHAHEMSTRNLWAFGLRHLDSLRTTEWPLNGPTDPFVAITLGGWSSNGRVYSGGFNSDHPAGAHFARGDGGVEFVADSIDAAVYDAAATIKCQDGVGGSTRDCNMDYDQ